MGIRVSVDYAFCHYVFAPHTTYVGCISRKKLEPMVSWQNVALKDDSLNAEAATCYLQRFKDGHLHTQKQA